MTKDNFGSEQTNPFLFAEGYGQKWMTAYNDPNMHIISIRPPGTGGQPWFDPSWGLPVIGQRINEEAFKRDDLASRDKRS